jgi:hypothetical protein
MERDGGKMNVGINVLHAEETDMHIVSYETKRIAYHMCIAAEFIVLLLLN